MNNAKSLNSIAEAVNSQPNIRQLKAQTMIQSIQEEMKNQAKKGKYEICAIINSDDLPMFEDFTFELKSLDYVLNTVESGNQTYLTISWK